MIDSLPATLTFSQHNGTVTRTTRTIGEHRARLAQLQETDRKRMECAPTASGTSTLNDAREARAIAVLLSQFKK